MEEWDIIEISTIRRTIESMPDRIEAIIEKSGNKIDY
jgi:hypothetical protein